MASTTKAIEELNGFLVPYDNKELISSSNVSGGFRIITSQAELDQFLSYSYVGLQEVGMIINLHIEGDNEHEGVEKFYRITKLAERRSLSVKKPAEIEEVKFDKEASAYTYSNSTITAGGIITADTVTIYSSTTQVIEDLLTRISYLEEKLKLVDRKATLYDANSNDDAKLTFIPPYSVNTQESMSGHTGIAIENEHFNSGLIDEEDNNFID